MVYSSTYMLHNADKMIKFNVHKISINNVVTAQKEEYDRIAQIYVTLKSKMQNLISEIWSF